MFSVGAGGGRGGRSARAGWGWSPSAWRGSASGAEQPQDPARGEDPETEGLELPGAVQEMTVPGDDAVGPGGVGEVEHPTVFGIGERGPFYPPVAGRRA